MPELPEVETVRSGLERLVVGRRIRSVSVRETRLRRPLRPAALDRLVRGRSIVAIERRAKYLILRLDDDACLLVHLGMTGAFFVSKRRALPERHLHLRLVLDADEELRFVDPRRFGLVEPVAPGAIATHPLLTSLGVEPLSSDFDPAFLSAETRGRRVSIKSLLMDAHVVVGVGNIYASESLFEAGVRPGRAAGRLSGSERVRIVAAVKSVLARAVAAGGTTLSDFRDARGESGYFQHDLRVYDREGEPCRRCAAVIRRRVLSGRSTFYCSACQR